MPELGEWDGPIYGSLGALEDDGDRAMCHCCGQFFGHLGNHVWVAHNLTAPEYRAIFGLRAQTGLIGPTLQAKRRKDSSRPAHVAFLHEVALPKAHAALTLEQRSANTSGRKRRLESKIKASTPEAEAARKANRAKGANTFRQKVERGEASYYTPPPEHQRRAAKKARVVMKELLQDPTWKDQWRKKISESRGGQEIVTCTICGTTFEAPRWTHRKLCDNPACLSEHKRRAALRANVAKRPDVARKIAAAGRKRVIERDEAGRIVTFSAPARDD